MKKRVIYIGIGLSVLVNLLIGLYIIKRNGDEGVTDYNKISMFVSIDNPNTAQAVAEVYFQDYLEERNVLDMRDDFTTTVMFDRDTFEWIVVYIPVSSHPIEMLYCGPGGYPCEVRLRMDHGIVEIKYYDFLEYWD